MSFAIVDEILFKHREAIPQHEYVAVMNEIHSIFKGKDENMISHSATATLSTKFKIVNKSDLINDDIEEWDLSDCEEAEDIEIITKRAHKVKLSEEVNMVEHYNNATRWDIANKLKDANFNCVCIYLDVYNLDSHIAKIYNKLNKLNNDKDIIYKKYPTERYFSSIRVEPDDSNDEILIRIPDSSPSPIDISDLTIEETCIEELES